MIDQILKTQAVHARVTGRLFHFAKRGIVFAEFVNVGGVRDGLVVFLPNVFINDKDVPRVALNHEDLGFVFCKILPIRRAVKH